MSAGIDAIHESSCDTDTFTGHEIIRHKSDPWLSESLKTQVPHDDRSWHKFDDAFFRACEQMNSLMLFYNYKQVSTSPCLSARCVEGDHG